MDRALYIAMTGAKHNTMSQTAEANNLANVNTTGFKRDFEQARSMPVFGEHYPTRAYALSERPASDFNPGTLVYTGRHLDLGIDNQGWFSVVGPDGEEAYTRRGDLRVDQLGRLINGEDLQVIGVGGPIVIPPYEQIEVAMNGTISIVAAGDEPAVVAELEQLKMVIPDPDRLEKSPDGLFRLRDKGENEVVQPDPTVEVVEGHLEQSNVKAVHSLIETLSLHRQYEMQVNMMKTVDENAQVTSQIMEIQ